MEGALTSWKLSFSLPPSPAPNPIIHSPQVDTQEDPVTWPLTKNTPWGSKHAPKLLQNEYEQIPRQLTNHQSKTSISQIFEGTNAHARPNWSAPTAALLQCPRLTSYSTGSTEMATIARTDSEKFSCTAGKVPKKYPTPTNTTFQMAAPMTLK